MWPPPPGGTWVVDLDGVVWLTGQPIPGVDEAVARLRGVGVRVLFATNNSAPTRAELHRQLAHCGITADDADLLRSADVAAGMLAPGSTAVVLGDDGVARGAGRPGRHRRARGTGRRRRGRAGPATFTYDALARAVDRGAGRGPPGRHQRGRRPTRPPTAWCPGAGALLAAVVTAAEADARGGRQAAPPDGRRHRRPGSAPGSSGSWWGTGPSTDGALAAQLGIPFALVLSGVTREGQVPADADPAVVAPDLLRLVRTDPRRHRDRSAC